MLTTRLWISSVAQWSLPTSITRPVTATLSALLAIVRLLGLLLGILSAVGALSLGEFLLLGRSSGRVRLAAKLPVVHLFCRYCAWLFGLRIETLGALPPRGALILANHQSYLDIVGLGALTRSFFMAKAEIESWPLLGLGTRLAAIPSVLRDNPVSGALAILETERRLGQGFRMVVFPEGTTSANREPLPFKTGLFERFAGRPNLIVPARLRYDGEHAAWIGEATLLGHLFQMARTPITRVEIVFSSPLRTETFSDWRGLLETCYAAVCHPRPIQDAAALYSKSFRKKLGDKSNSFEPLRHFRPGRGRKEAC